MIYDHILGTVGNTPMIRMELKEEGLENIRLYAKLEFLNPTGSVKDRAADYVIRKLLENKEIDNATTMIESSSGNFGIALAAYCKQNGLRFICVVDPHLTQMNEMLIKSFGAEVIKVTTPDENGGYLLTRIRKVKQLCGEIKNSYWVNQYGNPYNAEAYYHSLGGEICSEMEQLDYIFLGISSGGTITGVSRRIKEKYPTTKVIAVDIVGSVIFGHPPKKRYIPGIGSSMVPEILNHSKIDEVVMMDEVTTIAGCHELLTKYNVFAGGSSGSAYAAIKKYFKEHPGENTGKLINVVTVFPDRGERYCYTVYDQQWCTDFKKNHSEMKEL
jgi:2,3-diaminopropionate biosynthesis protein SbnA